MAMIRRGFLGLLVSSSVWPTLARAQGKPARIGVLIATNPEPFWSLLREGLRGHGYVEGRNVQLELRSADGKPERLQGLAEELVRREVDIIVAAQTPAVTAAKRATTTIPIVMAPAANPVGTGLVASLARPGGNVTGLSGTTTEMGSKLLEIVRDMLPATRRVAVLANGADPFTKLFLAQIEAGGRMLGLAIHPFTIRGVEEMAAALDVAVRDRADALIIQPSLPRKPAIELALQHRLPPVSPSHLFAGDGGLLSYAASQTETYRRAAVYVDRILKGAKPTDLPVEQPTRFELIVNMKTAKALGLSIAETFLIRADQVIE